MKHRWVVALVAAALAWTASAQQAAEKPQTIADPIGSYVTLAAMTCDSAYTFYGPLDNGRTLVPVEQTRDDLDTFLQTSLMALKAALVSPEAGEDLKRDLKLLRVAEASCAASLYPTTSDSVIGWRTRAGAIKQTFEQALQTVKLDRQLQ